MDIRDGDMWDVMYYNDDSEEWELMLGDQENFSDALSFAKNLGLKNPKENIQLVAFEEVETGDYYVIGRMTLDEFEYGEQ